LYKTTYKITKMDCPCEEQLIRIKLSELKNIKSLDFNIADRQLIVYHTDSQDEIFKLLDSLNFDTSIIETVSADISYKETNNKKEKSALQAVLFINLFFFILEILTGLAANSLGLVADSLDMLADSIVYGLALYAVGGSILRKKFISKAAGIFQMILAAAGFIEVIRRFTGHETFPSFQTMIIISMLALIGNAACLYILRNNNSTESHMRASVIFTSNDVIVNIAVIAAGILVYLTKSMYPDLIIGSIVFLIVCRGAYRILKLS